MSTLLVVDVSPRGERSVSRRLTNRFAEHWMGAHPGGNVMHRDLMTTRLPFLDQFWIGAAFTASSDRSPEMQAAIRISDELIAEVMAADHIVIGTPTFNLSIPAALKAWIDQIVRMGVTVSPEREGLLGGRKATVIVASGGRYAAGAAEYLRQILGFLGICEVSSVAAGETLAIDNGETNYSDFAAPFEAELAAAARV